MAYNWANLTDFGDLPSVANAQTGGTFWVGMLHMIWIILIMVMIGFGFEVAILAASFLCLVIALLLAYSGLVAWGFVIEFAAIILFFILYIIWSGSQKR